MITELHGRSQMSLVLNSCIHIMLNMQQQIADHMDVLMSTLSATYQDAALAE